MPTFMVGRANRGVTSSAELYDTARTDLLHVEADHEGRHYSSLHRRPATVGEECRMGLESSGAGAAVGPQLPDRFKRVATSIAWGLAGALAAEATA